MLDFKCMSYQLDCEQLIKQVKWIDGFKCMSYQLGYEQSFYKKGKS